MYKKTSIVVMAVAAVLAASVVVGAVGQSAWAQITANGGNGQANGNNNSGNSGGNQANGNNGNNINAGNNGNVFANNGNGGAGGAQNACRGSNAGTVNNCG